MSLSADPEEREGFISSELSSQNFLQEEGDLMIRVKEPKAGPVSCASRAYKSIPWVRQGIFLPESTFSADSLAASVHLCVPLHALTSVCTLKTLHSVAKSGGLLKP